MHDVGWTDTRVKTLERLWSEGHSASQIAQRLGNASRNAVIGKVNRMGLPSRRTVERKAPRKVVRPVKPVQRPAYLTHRPVYNADKAYKLPLPVETSLAIAETLEPRIASLLDLEDHHCRFPIGDNPEGAHAFCGRQKVEGLVYCETHARRCYTAVPERTGKPFHMHGTPAAISNRLKELA